MSARSGAAVPLLDIDFSDISRDAAIARLLARPEGARFTYIVTPNADHIQRLLRIPGLRRVYKRAMLCLLDSHFISRCATALGLAVPQVVTGADLTEALLPRLGGRRVAVIGMEHADFDRLARRFPGITFVHYGPPMALLHDLPAFRRTCDFIVATQAAVTFIALGSPVQELLAYAVAARPKAAGVGLCIGSALSFAAGATPRAPRWMQRQGLEWLFRLATNPRRLAGRYLLSDPLVLLALVGAALRKKMR